MVLNLPLLADFPQMAIGLTLEGIDHAERNVQSV